MYFMILLTMISCVKKENEQWKGEGKIDHIGEFKTKSMYTIKVENNDDIISFNVSDNSKHSVVTSTEGISNIHNWYLYWDDANKALWVYSSDIGSSVWLEQNSIFSETTITYKNQDKLPVKMPKEIEKDILE
ncbi:hypothetical protein Fjoh_2669 [Flavobacterium johnsoniae UW101]|uniref:Uncharacterized protein n=2 Tax=Flavobacterium johnsoniae TaxID=986 RepID=A5FGG9_FLAJ1|nr:hypothetical protein Fjoh_2669 [Flavobacterium johnsoniae UW101]